MTHCLHETCEPPNSVTGSILRCGTILLLLSRDHFATSSWRVILWGDQGESMKRVWSVIETDIENWADLRFSRDAELKDSHNVIDNVKELRCQE